jgi:Flp pilus assembly protein TadG
VAGEAPAKGILKGPFAERLPRLRAPFDFLRLSEHGTAVVEFALLAPLLFGILIGLLDFGQGLNYYNQQNQLTGLGARAAAVLRNPDGTAVSGTSIQHQLSTQYAKGALTGESFCITLPQGSGVGQPLKVSASYDFNMVPLTIVKFGLSKITIQASQTERQEAPFPTASTGCAS